jgi:hypothetical protein
MLAARLPFAPGQGPKLQAWQTPAGGLRFAGVGICWQRRHSVIGHQPDHQPSRTAPAPQARLAVPPEQAQAFKALWSARCEPAGAEEVSELLCCRF